jgi:hypothetical protein
VADGFIDGLNQRAGPRDILFENLPVRLESGDFFEVSLAQISLMRFSSKPSSR